MRVFKESTVELFTKRVDGLPYANHRALGWDTIQPGIPSPSGQKFSENSFGHTGYTGPHVWADKDKNLGVVVLDNRIYPATSSVTSVSNMWFRNNVMNMIVDIWSE